MGSPTPASWTEPDLTSDEGHIKRETISGPSAPDVASAEWKLLNPKHQEEKETRGRTLDGAQSVRSPWGCPRKWEGLNFKDDERGGQGWMLQGPGSLSKEPGFIPRAEKDGMEAKE